MFILYSSTRGDPVLLDSPSGLRSLDREFRAFLNSSSIRASFPAITTGDPAPYSHLLAGLRVEKTQGASQLYLAGDRWLELTGCPQDLSLLAKALSGLDDGNHHHWYTSPVSLIIEADESRASCEGS
ncbi:MAG TPA: hypothetical protein VGI93_20055 [Steroidobacteraceae bacterium]|jgi:hypothetical protein